MKAIAQDSYCGPEGLVLREVEKPGIESDTVLVRVRAASVNPLDWHFMRGEPYVMRLATGLRRPKLRVRGVDVAGIVDTVGSNVTRFRPGDAVFGSVTGAFAEYVAGRERNFVSKPDNLTFEQAASLPVAGVTALQGLRDKGELAPGQLVLVNGAAGGVGTFAVQIALAMGASVTGVCSTRNLELVHSLGAAEVIDYTSTDFAKSGRQFDIVLDAVGNRSFADLRRATKPRGTIVLAGGGGGKLLGPLAQSIRALFVRPFAGRRIRPYLARITNPDLIVLKDLCEASTVTPVIDRSYPLSEAGEAVRYLEQRHARGKVTITIGEATGG